MQDINTKKDTYKTEMIIEEKQVDEEITTESGEAVWILGRHTIKFRNYIRRGKDHKRVSVDILFKDLIISYDMICHMDFGKKCYYPERSYLDERRTADNNKDLQKAMLRNGLK